eukprot:CAMPEP_0194066776 /NCGR_PEP_ID=MMETSP0009_2-20130614/86207_1 /TAXON_ID=210454 /ORGANISM="Grammatophora oceanica, Strain CCMP 410" /LENGTH=176 /DNA_ID=CAMNT_0038719761 /DNA_START=52 /DNA_END=580 /DNA_ORIENTATION=+
METEESLVRYILQTAGLGNEAIADLKKSGLTTVARMCRRYEVGEFEKLVTESGVSAFMSKTSYNYEDGLRRTKMSRSAPSSQEARHEVGFGRRLAPRPADFDGLIKSVPELQHIGRVVKEPANGNCGYYSLQSGLMDVCGDPGIGRVVKEPANGNCVYYSLQSGLMDAGTPEGVVW